MKNKNPKNSSFNNMSELEKELERVHKDVMRQQDEAKKQQDEAKKQQHDKYVQRGIPQNIIEILESKKLKKNQQERVERLPWESIKNQPTFSDEDKVQEMLDKSHIGLDDVKSRIMDYYCTEFRNGAVLLLVGPPGVGKTSIALQIANACNRPWYKVSLSGIASAHEIIGVDPTFSDAAPGEIIRAIEYTNTFYPLIILDEIDKVGHSKEHGDPQNALLEVLDTNRESFRDRFLGIPIDLSNFIFIATANDLSDISPILRDRLEIIEIGGYNKTLKKQILKNQVIPNMENKILEGTKEIYSIDDGALNRIVNEYVVEPGVRELYDYADKLIRHANRLYQYSHKKSIITEQNLEDFIGHPKKLRFARDLKSVIGNIHTVILRSTKYAALLKIHTSVLEHGKGQVICTGGIEGFAKEAVAIAKSLVRHYSDVIGIPSNYFSDKDIHVDSEYYPTIKANNCVSLAIFIGLVSTILRQPISLGDMFAGDLSLDGSINYVNNIEEFIEAAIESNIKKAYISYDNFSGNAKLLEKYNGEITIIPFATVKDVLREIFNITIKEEVI